MTYSIKRNCEICGNEFTVTRLEQRFCSKACYGEYRRLAAAKNPKMFSTPKKGEWVACQFCGKVYWRIFSRPQKTCGSKECRSKIMSGENNPKYKGKIKLHCVYCGKEFEVWPCKQFTNKRFCSKDCWYKWRSENIVGDKVYNYKEGRQRDYCKLFNNNFKERVRIFFLRRCFICGAIESGEAHSVHHVLYNKKACCDDSIRLFVPLCRDHHAETTNSRDRAETERYFAKVIYERTNGKCYYSAPEMQKIYSDLQDLTQFNKWTLIQLATELIQPIICGPFVDAANNPTKENNKKKNPISMGKCLYCGKVFSYYPAEKLGKYCCLEHYNLMRKQLGANSVEELEMRNKLRHSKEPMPE